MIFFAQIYVIIHIDLVVVQRDFFGLLVGQYLSFTFRLLPLKLEFLQVNAKR